MRNHFSNFPQKIKCPEEQEWSEPWDAFLYAAVWDLASLEAYRKGSHRPRDPIQVTFYLIWMEAHTRCCDHRNLSLSLQPSGPVQSVGEP